VVGREIGDPQHLALVVVKGEPRMRRVGQIGGDVVLGDLDQSVLHVLGMNELDVIDQIQLL
jgi:hypothetical protein